MLLVFFLLIGSNAIPLSRFLRYDALNNILQKG